jgi:hypothetical protein
MRAEQSAMGWWAKFSKEAVPAAPGESKSKPGRARGEPAAVITSQPTADPRQDLLRLALQHTLERHRVPSAWIGADAMAVVGRAGSGLHIRLVLLHWEPTLMAYLPALQDDLEQQLLAMDEGVRTWLRGFSWQFQWMPGVRRMPVRPAPPWTAESAVR